MSAPFRVLATSAFFEPGYRGGGPIRSLARIVDTLPAGVDFTLVTSDRDLGDSHPYSGLSGTWTRRGDARVFYLDVADRRQRSALWASLRPVDLLYVNSLFDPRFSIAAIVAARLRRIRTGRILLAPRGELAPAALDLKADKKRHFLQIWKRVLAGMDVTWHATSDMEAAHIRKAVPGADVIVCSDRGSTPDLMGPAEPSSDTARLVFVSRIARMKNLDLTLEALAGVNTRVDLDIFGPVEDATYWQECQAIIARLPQCVGVRYCGELAHDQVRTTFATYDAFVLPTRGENFGHVISEALSASCPVICSDRTPWTATLQDGGGMVVNSLTPRGVRATLQRFASTGPAERDTARRNAGAAYLRWRDNPGGRHIIEQVRHG